MYSQVDKSRSDGRDLAALEQRQLVERRAHPDDGRCVVMSVTTAGQHRLVAAIPPFEQLAERL
ncbi:MAG: hypothetical protein WCC65_00910 [Pseudonocardiaceae bacterium]